MSPASDRATTQSGVRTGRILSDKYRLLGKLGEGGMGEVYAAEHTFVGRRFAVKFLHKELARDEQIMARFRREAQAAGSLENENIVAVTDFGYADDGTPYIVMEYLIGEDLRGLLTRSGRLGVKRAVELVIQACRGLHAAHARGFVHRDLKPENLFVTKRGDDSDLLKVLDFGIAKLRGMHSSSASTKAGTVLGTLLYMPPEQVRGEKDTDHRADIYALGAILYEALSGRVPHPGDQAHAIMYHILNERPAPLASLRSDVSPELIAVIDRALATEARDRYQSAAELLDALAPFSGRQITPLQSGATVQARATVPLPVDAQARAASGSAELAASSAERPASIKPRSETDLALEAAGLSRTATGKRRMIWMGAWVLALVVLGLALARLREQSPVRAPTVTATQPTARPDPASSPSLPAPSPSPPALPPAPIAAPIAAPAPSAAAASASERPAEHVRRRTHDSSPRVNRRAPPAAAPPAPDPQVLRVAPIPAQTTPPRSTRTTLAPDRENPFD